MRRFLTIFLALAFALALLSCSKTQEQPAREEGTGGIAEKTSGDSIAVEVNSPAPAFAAKVMGGGELRLADHVGKVVLLEFWSIFCKSCLQEMPSVKELHKRYKDKGFEVISVNTDAFTDARVMQVLQKAGLNFDYPVVRDIRREISEAYNVQILPVTVVIDRSGWIRLYQEGYAPGEEVRFAKAIEKYLDAEQKDDVTLAPRGGVTRFAPKGANSLAEKPAKAEIHSRKTLKGREVKIGDKPAALFFWSLYCQPCRDELPEVEKLRAQMSGKGVEFLAINVDSAKLTDRVSKFLAPYPDFECVNDEFSDSTPNLSKAYGIEETPSVVLLDAKGEVSFVSRGDTDLGGLGAKIGALTAK